MAYYLVLALSCFLAFFIAKSYRHIFYQLAENSVKALDTILSAEDDELKLELLQTSTTRLIVALLKSFVLIFIVALIIIVSIFSYAFFANIPVSDIDISSVQSILAISVGASLPFLIARKKQPKNDYNELSQLLHKMALNNYTLMLKLFKREVKRNNRIEKNEQFVIVSGLARAGTTTLMNSLFKTGQFASLNYTNMPFILSPNLWRKLYQPKQKEVKERSHKDGIKIGLDSNEALEEYFFKAKTNDSFINEHVLDEHDVDAEVYQDYLDYHRLIKTNDNQLYIAKNNNFLLRYKSIRKLNQTFLFVILYRQPLFHAASLLEKHQLYKTLQKEDPFVLQYMNWLGHHEFGLNQKQFLFHTSTEIEGDKNTLDYWLKIWIDYYQYALTAQNPKTIFVNYEFFCSNPKNIVNQILEKSGKAQTEIDYIPYHNLREITLEHSQEILHQAEEIYNELQMLSRQ